LIMKFIWKYKNPEQSKWNSIKFLKKNK
jgi:hypothetical protein